MTTADAWPRIRDWVESGGDPIVVRTSGSTGDPKDIALSHAAVMASARASLDRLGGPGAWVSALPATGIGGLQVLVRSALAGIDPVVAVDLDDVIPPGADRSYVSLVPTQLFRLDRTSRLDQLADFDAVLLGGAAVDPDLLERAAGAGVRVVRTYGMTETCGGCVYDGLPLDGVSVRVVEDHVEVTGAVLADALDLTDDGWFRTGDLGEIGADGRLRVSGRADDVINSGGVKIPLPAVTRALGRIDGVREAVALGRDDPEWGQRVVAVVVADDAVCLDGLRLDVIRDAVEDQGLDRAWAPREVVLVDELPLLPNGKIDRQTLLGRR